MDSGSDAMEGSDFDGSFSDFDEDDNVYFSSGDEEKEEDEEYEKRMDSEGAKTFCLEFPNAKHTTHTHTETLNIGIKKVTSSGLSYVVRSPDEMVLWMEKIAECVSEDHNLSIHQSRTLLSHHEYNIEKLCDNLKYEFDKTFKNAGLSFDHDAEMEVENSSDTVTCDGNFFFSSKILSSTLQNHHKSFSQTVCWDDFPSRDMDSLECDHQFCKCCWKRHVTESVTSNTGSGLDRRRVVRLTCMHKKCDTLVPIEKLELYGGKEFVSKRNLWYAEDIATKVPKFKSCPAVNCSNVLEFAFTEAHIQELCNETGELECTCGHVFCWICLREAHSPCSCEEVNDWRSLSSEDAAVERLKSKCKQCPGCGTGCYINDKTACNHMICPCGHEWCWMCGGDWAGHGNSYYSCSKYMSANDSSDLKKRSRERDKRLADIQRLDDYEDRVSRMAAGSTGKAASDLYKKVFKMRNDLEKCCGFTERELEFLWDAYRTVIHMKRMLKWSWVFLFFRPESDNDSERVLFDNQRGQLEFMCDALHEKLDPIKEEDKKQFDSFLSPHKETRDKFLEWKASLISLLTQISKFGESITSAALKGTTIIDVVERERVQRRLAKERLKLVDWQFYDGKTWIMFDSDTSEVLELSKLMRQKACTCRIKSAVMTFDLVRNVRLVGPGFPVEHRIRRQVKAKLARNVWKCAKCGYQTPKDLNACSGCGTVRGH